MSHLKPKKIVQYSMFVSRAAVRTCKQSYRYVINTAMHDLSLSAVNTQCIVTNVLSYWYKTIT